MTDVTQFLHDLNSYLTGDRIAMLYWIFNAAVQALPDPNGNKFYLFIFRFAHTLAGNINVVRKSIALPATPQTT